MISFDHNFDNPHVNILIYTPENTPKSSNFYTKDIVFNQESV